MKYIDKYLLPAYYNILDGNIIIDSIALPIYDFSNAPTTPLGSYILLADITSSQTPAKGRFTSEVYILIDVIIIGDSFGFEDAEDAAEQITLLINSDNNPNLSPNFQVVTTSLQSSNRVPSLSKTDNVFRVLIRYRHLVNQI